MIDLQSQEQIKLTSDVITDTYAPCFINGGTEFVAVGAYEGVEIWDVGNKTSVKKLELKESKASASTNNILGFGSVYGVLRLWDVRNWEVLYSSTFAGMNANSLHLTSDLKYLTIAGTGDGDGCVVLEIK